MLEIPACRYHCRNAHTLISIVYKGRIQLMERKECEKSEAHLTVTTVLSFAFQALSKHKGDLVGRY
jgi:hypothetical protein